MPPTHDWLTQGTALEADWGSYVTRLAIRGELGSAGEGILLDLPALAQPYTCNSVACAPALRAAGTRSCCADLDVEVSAVERHAIEQALPEIAAWMRERDPRWGAPAPFVGEFLARPGGRCVFAAAGLRGHSGGLTCGLHAVEDAGGRPRGSIKPLPCRLFPLIAVDLGEERLLLTAVSPATARCAALPSAALFPCLRGDTTTTVPLVRSVADTLGELWGAEVAEAASRAVDRWRRARR